MKKHIPTEKSITKSILTYLNSIKGCRAVKMQGTINRAGEPDVFCCYKGRLVLFEVKRPGNKPTMLQEATLGMWHEAGAVTAVVYSVDDVKKVLEGIL